MSAFSPTPRAPSALRAHLGEIELRRIMPERLVRPASLLLGTIAVLLIGVFCARLAASHYGKTAIYALIGVPLLIAVAQRPLIAIMALLAVASSIFTYGSLPRVNVPGHPPINVVDLLLIAAVGGTLLRRPWHSWPVPVRRYAVALLVFVLVSAVATFKTLSLGHVEARAALYNFRNFLYLAAAITIALELRGELWKPFLNAAIVFAAIIGALSVAGALSPSVAHVLRTLTPWSVQSAARSFGSTTAALGTGARIRLQGLYFVYAMIIPTLAMAIMFKDRWRPYRVLALVLMVGAVAVSLNRNMYAGTVVGLLVTGLLGGPALRVRLGLVIAAVAVALVLVIATAIVPAVSASVGKRAATLASPSQILQSGSISDRTYELSFALPAIGRHPWFGVGPLQPYGALDNQFTITQRTSVQDLYIDLATDYGIPAALAFLIVPGMALWFGVRHVGRSRDPLDRALLSAAVGMVVALLLSLLVGTYVQTPESTTAFGVALGLLLACSVRMRELAPSRTHGSPSN